MSRSKIGKLKKEIRKYHGVYNSPDTFSKQIHQGKVEDYQMEPGKFYGELTQIITPRVTLGIHKFNHKIFRTGIGRKDHTIFMFPGDIGPFLQLQKSGFSSIRIGLIKGGMQRCTILPRDFFGTPISLDNDYMTELILKLNYEKTLFTRIQQNESVEISEKNGYKIRKVMMELFNSDAIDEDKLTIELPLLLIKSLNETVDKLPKKTTKTRKALFYKSLSFIEQNIHKPIKLKDVYSYLGTSERNLRYIYNDLAELSPMKFIKYLKLNKVRKDLINTPEKSKIKEIANRWGFNHSGQFAADYKKLFGEFPSETVSVLGRESQS